MVSFTFTDAEEILRLTYPTDAVIMDFRKRLAYDEHFENEKRGEVPRAAARSCHFGHGPRRAGTSRSRFAGIDSVWLQPIFPRGRASGRLRILLPQRTEFPPH